MRELFLLWLVGLAVLAVDDLFDGHGLLDRKSDCCGDAGPAAESFARALVVHQFRTVGILQVLQFFSQLGKLRNIAFRSSPRADLAAQDHFASWNFLLYISGGRIHGRRL